MKMFIWNKVDWLTNNYHADGGCAVVAASLEAARELLPKEQNGHQCEAQTKEPDAVYPLDDPTTEPRAFIFPDAGCC